MAALINVPFASFTLAEEVIRIGSISILTGEGASWGTAAKNGLSMAVDEINDKGGILGKKIVVDYQDDQGDPKTTISVFRHLVDNVGVKFIIGPTWARCATPLIKEIDSKQIIVISPSVGMAEFNESSDFIFNTWPHDYISSQGLADFVYNKGHRNVALVGAEDPWVKEQTANFKKRFVELGGKIVFQTELLPGTTDLKTIALKLAKTKGVDSYVSTTDGIVIGSLVAKSLKQLAFDLPKYSVTIDQSAIDAAGGGFEGLEFPTSLTPTEGFKKRYEEKFKINPEIGADTAYDAMMMIAQSITEVDSINTVEISKNLLKVKTYQGESGYLKADGKGGFSKDFKMKKVVGGKQTDLN